MNVVLDKLLITTRARALVLDLHDRDEWCDEAELLALSLAAVGVLLPDRVLARLNG